MRIGDFRIFENLQRARKILSDNKVAETDPRFVELRHMLQRNVGYIGQFTKWMIENRKSVEYLKTLYDRLRANRIDKAIEGFDRPEDLIDYIISKTSEKDLNEIYAEMTRPVKNMIEESDDEGYNDNIREFISQNLQHKDIIKKFIATKASRYDDGGELLEALEKEIKDTSKWPERLKQLQKDSHVVYKDDGIIVLLATDYSVMEEYGSSYWCITEDEDTFNSYVEEGFQLIIFFTQVSPTENVSMMGLTVDQNGLTGKSKSPTSHVNAAHWRNDDGVSDREMKSIIEKYPVLGKSDLMKGLLYKSAISRLEDGCASGSDVSIIISYIKAEKDEDKASRMSISLTEEIFSNEDVFDNIEDSDLVFLLSKFNESQFTEDIVETLCDKTNIVKILKSLKPSMNVIVKFLNYLQKEDSYTYADVVSLLKLNKNTVKLIDFNKLPIKFISTRTPEEIETYKDKFIESIISQPNTEIIEFLHITLKGTLNIFLSDPRFLAKVATLNIPKNSIESIYPRIDNPKIRSILLNKYLNQQPAWFKDHISLKLPEIEAETKVIPSSKEKKKD